MQKNLFFLLLIMATMFAIPSCSKDKDDEPQYKFTNQTMYNGETYTIPNSKNAKWESSNFMVAIVNDDVVTAFCAGTARISSELGSFEVTVKTKLDSFKEPYLEWGASMSEVKTFMKNYTEGNSTSDILIYNGISPVDMYAYSFKSNRLNTAACILPTSKISAETVANFLSERYFPISAENNQFIFISPDKKTGVILSIETMNKKLVYYIFYLEYEDTTRSNSYLKSEILKESKMYFEKFK